MGRGDLAVVVLLGLGGWAACNGQYESSEQPRGGNNQACFENETCFGDLVCFVGRCLSKDNFEGGVPVQQGSSTSSSSSSSSGASSTTSSTSSSSGNLPFDPARAACEYSARCYPNTFKAEHASVDACIKEALVSTAQYPGVDATCTEKTYAAPCGEFPPACSKGTLATSANCTFGGQCSSANCKGYNGTNCGVCALTKKQDDPCSPTDYTCGGDLRCDFAANKCVKAALSGDDCSGAAAGNCGTGLVCLNSGKKCGKQRDIGGACEFFSGTTISADCRGGLTCVAATKKCADVPPIKLLALFDACDIAKYATERCRSNAACGAGKCVPYIAKDGACPDASTPCGPGLTCTAAKCVSIDTICK